MKQAVLLTVTAVGWLYYCLTAGTLETADDISPIDIVAEGSSLCLYFAWMFIIAISDMSKKPKLLIVYGFFLLSFSQTIDVTDEFRTYDMGYWEDALESLQPIGLAIATIGLLLWVMGQQNSFRQLQRANLGYRRQSITDDLTQLYNAGYMRSRVPKIIEQAHDQQIPLALLLLDIDHFKAFNDTHGHPQGDRVIAALAQVIQDTIREDDVAFRYGGEEFVITIRQVEAKNVFKIADRIRENFANIKYPLPNNLIESRSVSIGVAMLTPHDTFDDLLCRADEAMYLAKQSGRNQVRMAKLVMPISAD